MLPSLIVACAAAFLTELPRASSSSDFTNMTRNTYTRCCTRRRAAPLGLGHPISLAALGVANLVTKPNHPLTCIIPVLQLAQESVPNLQRLQVVFSEEAWHDQAHTHKANGAYCNVATGGGNGRGCGRGCGRQPLESVLRAGWRRVFGTGR